MTPAFCPETPAKLRNLIIGLCLTYGTRRKVIGHFAGELPLMVGVHGRFTATAMGGDLR